MLKDHLKPRFVILLGTKAKLEGTEGRLFDPDKKFGINWKRPDTTVSFQGYRSKTYSYRIWNQKRADQKQIHFVMWPQHPSRAPMTNFDVWEASGRDSSNTLSAFADDSGVRHYRQELIVSETDVSLHHS